MADRVLLLVDHKKNHVLLAEWLAQRYSVTSANSAASVDDSPDLIILDGPALDRLWEPIRDRKSGEEPLFLPVLLIINRQDVGMVTRQLWRAVDELILIPIEKVELLARVEVLLRARQFSLDLHTVNQELWRKIDELHQTQASLLWSNNRFERAAQVVDGVIYDWNVPQNTVELSRSLEHVLGVPDRQTMLYREWWNGHTHPDDIERVAQTIEAALDGDSGYSLEYRVERKTGDYAVMWDRATIIRSPEGDANRVIGFLLDVTQQKRAEEERALLLEHERELRIEAERARQDAEEANRLKLNFLAMISHELRTPLTSIKGFSSTMTAADVLWSVEDLQDFAHIIDDEASRMQDLIEQLLDLSRLQAGTFQVSRLRIDLGAIIDAAQTQLNTLTGAHKLVVDIPGDLPAVSADTQRIAQVLVNLVGNAAKFAPEGSEITIAAAPDEEMACVRVEVRDEGPGIPQHERKRVFEAFRQLDRSMRGRKGAGLGLAICKGIIAAHGGEISVSPDNTDGTTIVFTLPIVRQSQP